MKTYKVLLAGQAGSELTIVADDFIIADDIYQFRRSNEVWAAFERAATVCILLAGVEEEAEKPR